MAPSRPFDLGEWSLGSWGSTPPVVWDHSPQSAGIAASSLGGSLPPFFGPLYSWGTLKEKLLRQVKGRQGVSEEVRGG